MRSRARDLTGLVATQLRSGLCFKTRLPRIVFGCWPRYPAHRVGWTRPAHHRCCRRRSVGVRGHAFKARVADEGDHRCLRRRCVTLSFSTADAYRQHFFPLLRSVKQMNLFYDRDEVPRRSLASCERCMKLSAATASCSWCVMTGTDPTTSAGGTRWTSRPGRSCRASPI
jgi:hypothetical protein